MGNRGSGSPPSGPGGSNPVIRCVRIDASRTSLGMPNVFARTVDASLAACAVDVDESAALRISGNRFDGCDTTHRHLTSPFEPLDVSLRGNAAASSCGPSSGAPRGSVGSRNTARFSLEFEPSPGFEPSTVSSSSGTSACSNSDVSRGKPCRRSTARRAASMPGPHCLDALHASSASPVMRSSISRLSFTFPRFAKPYSLSSLQLSLSSP